MNQKTEDRRQKSDDRRHKTQDRRQKTEVRKRKTDDRSQITEDRKQKSEGRRQKTEVRRQRKIFFSVICLLSSVICLLSLAGCEAFVRKFTRKPKKENLPKEEMVIAPVEYKTALLSKEETYRQYFLFWKSWQDELVEALSNGANHKKQILCCLEAIKNLEELNKLLNKERQEKMAVFINRLGELKESIEADLYGSNTVISRFAAERIRRDILREFSYTKIK